MFVAHMSQNIPETISKSSPVFLMSIEVIHKNKLGLQPFLQGGTFLQDS
jgi:hypothetical protein